MKPERWQSVKAALHEAMTLAGAPRAEYLAALAARDPQLGQEVESLLAADAADSRRLETPAPAALDAVRLNAFVGRRVGAWRLLEEIGSGGMGEIYRAVRDDDTYRQEVAVKLVRSGPGTAYIGERLRSERQILANLEHPNIARLLDGGTTSDGVPYLVMELVDGQPIDEYCRRTGLDTDARLRLFIQVCEAVQYAHRHMVIHRDLKPGNILVTAEGAPKLLDFGIAKLLDPGAMPVAGEVTLAPFKLFTPGYASPEQLKGESVTTATDVYSLGVILCELLTGSTPLAAAASTGADATSRLDADLRNILGMALRLEPDRRYATVEQLAQDLRRHLAHLPVIARPDTLGYRFSTFIRRHRVGVAAAAFVTVALVGGLIASLYEAQVARAALTRATSEAHAASAVTAYLESLFDAASPEHTGGKPIDPRALIDQGQSQIEARLAAEPLLRARMLAATGALYCKIGQSAQCRANLEQALAAEPASGGDPLQRARLQTQLAGAYTTAGRADEAIALLQQARPVLEAQQPRDAPDLVALWCALGGAWRVKVRPSEEIRAFEEARRIQLGGAGADPMVTARILGALAIAYSDAGRWGESLAVADQRVALVRQVVGTDDVRYVDAQSDLGEVAQGAARFAEAEAAFRAAADGYVRFYGRASDKSIDTELSLADALAKRDKLRESIAEFRRAVDDYRAQGNLERAEYLGALGGLSMLLIRSGDFRESERAAREAYGVSQRMHGPSPREGVFAAYRLGHALAFTGSAREGLKLLEAEMPGDPQALRIRRFHGLRLLWRGDCYRELGDYGHAAQSYDEAIALYESLHQPQSIALNMAYEGKALMLEREGRFADAEPLLRRAIAGYSSNQYLPDGPAIAAARIELAASLERQGEVAGARALITSARAIVARELASAHPARLALAQLEAQR